MIEIQSIADIELLRESVDLECKLAGGRDGQGAVPDDFWPTYSAFANAQGGMVLLGLREKNGQFETVGIQNVAKVRKDRETGEQAGTGIPKILHGWQSQHWSPPKLYDTAEPYNQTLIELRMADLFPAPVMAGLKARFGERFEGLSYVERVALALAASEGTVNHARLRGVTIEHPVDLSRVLQHLTQAGMLESTGGRGAVYHMPGEAIPTPEDIFGTAPAISAPSSPHLDGSSPHLDGISPDLDGSSPDLADQRNAEGCLLSDWLSLPIIDDLARLSVPLRQRLEAMAAEPRSKGKISREKLIAVVLALCAEHFITLRCLAELVNRQPNALRDHYLTGLVQERKLSLAFPKTPTHERQAYCSSSALSE